MYTLFRKEKILYNCQSIFLLDEKDDFLQYLPQFQSAKKIYIFKWALKPLIDPCNCQSLI